MLDALVLADRAVEHHALARIGGGAAQRILADADGFHADEDALGVEAIEDVAEAPPLLADAVGLGHEQPVDEDGVGVDRLAAHLGDLAHLDLGAVEVGVKNRDAIGGPLHVLEAGGAGQQHDLVGDLGGGRPHLLPAYEIAAGHLLGEGLDLGGVEPRVWLRDAEAAFVFAGDETRNPLGFLRGRAVHHDRVRPEQVDVHAGGGRHAAAVGGDLVHHDGGLGHAQARATVGLRHGNAEPAALGHGAVEIMWEIAVLVALQPVFVAEARDGGAHAFAQGRVVGLAVVADGGWNLHWVLLGRGLCPRLAR